MPGNRWPGTGRSTSWKRRAVWGQGQSGDEAGLGIGGPGTGAREGGEVVGVMLWVGEAQREGGSTSMVEG
jgi:hypothetical protein